MTLPACLVCKHVFLFALSLVFSLYSEPLCTAVQAEASIQSVLGVLGVPGVLGVLQTGTKFVNVQSYNATHLESWWWSGMNRSAIYSALTWRCVRRVVGYPEESKMFKRGLKIMRLKRPMSDETHRDGGILFLMQTAPLVYHLYYLIIIPDDVQETETLRAFHRQRSNKKQPVV